MDYGGCRRALRASIMDGLGGLAGQFKLLKNARFHGIFLRRLYEASANPFRHTPFLSFPDRSDVCRDTLEIPDERGL